MEITRRTILGTPIGKAQAQAEARKLVSAYPVPPLRQDRIDRGHEDNTLYRRWTEKLALLAHGHECCPKCAHTWPRAAEALAPYADVPDRVAQPWIDADHVIDLGIPQPQMTKAVNVSTTASGCTPALAMSVLPPLNPN